MSCESSSAGGVSTHGMVETFKNALFLLPADNNDMVINELCHREKKVINYCKNIKIK